MLQKKAISEISTDSPDTQDFWRVASSNRIKTTERPHRRSLLSHAHSAEYRQKMRLRVQDRSAECVLSSTNTSRQQEVPSFCLRKTRYQLRVIPFGLNTATQVFTRLVHTAAAYLHREGISVIPYLDNWLIHHPDHQVLLRHQSQLVNTLNMVGLKLNKAKSELEPVQDIQFLGLRLCPDQGIASLPVSKVREIIPH